MSMFLVEGLSEAISKILNKALVYFFCDSSYDTRKTAIVVVCRLLLQLVQQHPWLIEHVLPQYEERKYRAFDSFNAAWAVFLKACADQATGRKYCIIDALDECEQDEQETLLKQIEETFGRSGAGGLNVNFAITSRPYLEIDGYLYRFPYKDLSSFEESRRDVDKFIDDKVAKLRDMKNYTKNIEANITHRLYDKTGGIFL